MASKKKEQAKASVKAVRNFHHNKKAFQAGQELSAEEIQHCSESMEALKSEGLLEESQEQEQE